MRLSVLDQAPITKGNDPAAALLKAEELAILADELGYERMWMAEHHGTDSYASSAPEVTAARLAAKTKNIRIGTGGVMMMHYSPLKMAEVFKTLSAFSPGRIDFGVGRAPGGGPNAMYALSEGREPLVHNMYQKFETALDLISDHTPQERLYLAIRATPSHVTLPAGAMLRSSEDSAIQTASIGAGYSFAQLFNCVLTKEIIDAYRHHFEPSVFMEKPSVNVAYMVTVAETREEAEYEALPQDIVRLQMNKGDMVQTLSPEEAKDFPLTDMDRERIKNNRQLHIVGTAEDVADKLQQEQENYGFDEAMIVSIPHSQEKRLDAYRLLARELF